MHVTGTTKPHVAHQCNQNQLDPLPSPHASKPLPLPELWEPSRGPLSPHLSCFYLLLGMCVCSVVSKSLPRMDRSPPGSSVHGIFQARILKWVAISFSRWPSRPKDWTHVSSIGRQIPYHWTTREAHRVPFSPPCLAFIVYRFFDDGHSYWCEVISHYSFDLHFSNNEWCWACFHVFVSHL